MKNLRISSQQPQLSNADLRSLCSLEIGRRLLPWYQNQLIISIVTLQHISDNVMGDLSYKATAKLPSAIEIRYPTYDRNKYR